MLYFISAILLSQQGGLLVAFLESIYHKSYLLSITLCWKSSKQFWILLPGPKLEETSIQIVSNWFPIISVLRALRDLPGKFNILLFCTLSFFLLFFFKGLKCSRNYLHLIFESKHLFITSLSLLGLFWFLKDRDKIKI